MNLKRKAFISLALSLLMATSVASAAKKQEKLPCSFRDIKIQKNGQAINVSREPFIYDGTTFLPLRDVTENFGYSVVWDDATSTIRLSGGASSDVTLLKQDLQNKDIMISQLQSQIQTLKTERDNLKKKLDDEDSSSSSDKDVDDLEDDLKDDYSKYTKGDEVLKFSFSVKEKSSTVTVTMEGDFDRGKSEWKDRNASKFEDFIEDIAKASAKALDKDVTVIVEDKNNKEAGEYSYDEDKKKFKKESEYGSSSSSKDSDSEIEDMLEDDYSKYTKGSKNLEFEYSVKVGSDEITVTMKLQDYKKTDSEWKDRNESKFDDFIESLAKDIAKIEEDKDVSVKVYSEKDSSTKIYSESFKAKDID